MDGEEPTSGQVYSFRGGRNEPPPPEAPRRLAAIVAGDIAGYSRLMGMDEEGTHARVRRHQREIIKPTIAEHHGKLIKYTGDGFLAMFDSPVEAVRAIVIQHSMLVRNAGTPHDQRILYRIGVHLGDVIVEPDDIYGDGVNISVRLEGIANPGDVFISGGIYEQIKNKVVYAYQALGNKQVKNITDPITVYRVLPDPAALMSAQRGRRMMIFALSVVLLVVLGGAIGFYVWSTEQSSSTHPTFTRTEDATTPQAPATARVESPPVLPPAPALPAAPAAKPPAPAGSAPAATTPSTSSSNLAAGSSAASPAAGTAIPVALPEMVALPGGEFLMGSNDHPWERPVHRVTIKPFAISKFPITNREWRQCVAERACNYVPIGKDDAPVTNISWDDAKQFVGWLSMISNKNFRLPTEAEWEYAARGGTQTRFWWGDQFQSDMLYCQACGSNYDSAQPAAVGSSKPNPFGLHDMGGNVGQWVEDCWHGDYQNAPIDGSAWVDKFCATRVVRSGSWKNNSDYVRTASRYFYDAGVRYLTHGLRVSASP